VAHFTHDLATALSAWISTARLRYGVDPVVWLIIGTAASPAFYYSLYRLARAISRRATQQIMLWSMVFGCAVVAPYVYVLFFGHNLPWWVYVAVALLIGQATYTLARKANRKNAAASEGDDSLQRPNRGEVQ
jgi:hypothetical protein